MDKTEIMWAELSKEIKDCKCDFDSLSHLIKLTKKTVERYNVKDWKEMTIVLLSKIAEECMSDEDEELFFKMLKNGSIHNMLDVTRWAAVKVDNVKKAQCCIIM